MSHTGSNCYQMQKKLIQTGKAKEGYFQGMRWWLCPISIVVVQLLSVQLFAVPWTAARQASLSHYLLEFAQIHVHWVGDAIQPSHPLLFPSPLPSIFPRIRVFSNESALCIRWPKYWSFSFSIFLPKNTQDWSPLEWTGWISLQSKGLSRVFSNTTVQKHRFFTTQLSSQSNTHIHT